MFKALNQVLLVATAASSTSLFVNAISTDDVYASLKNSVMVTGLNYSARQDDSHPMLGDTPAALEFFIECLGCKALHQGFAAFFYSVFPQIEDEEISMRYGKQFKGYWHLFCMFRNSPRTCMRYIQTYVDLTAEHIWGGVLSEAFFCSVIIPVCDEVSFRRSTL